MADPGGPDSALMADPGGPDSAVMAEPSGPDSAVMAEPGGPDNVVMADPGGPDIVSCDVDIYADIVDYSHEEVERLVATCRRLNADNQRLAADATQLRARLAELERSRRVLRRSFSSLMLTARAEITRKDARLEELQRLLDHRQLRCEGRELSELVQREARRLASEWGRASPPPAPDTGPAPDARRRRSTGPRRSDVVASLDESNVTVQAANLSFSLATDQVPWERRRTVQLASPQRRRRRRQRSINWSDSLRQAGDDRPGPGARHTPPLPLCGRQSAATKLVTGPAIVRGPAASSNPSCPSFAAQTPVNERVLVSELDNDSVMTPETARNSKLETITEDFLAPKPAEECDVTPESASARLVVPEEAAELPVQLEGGPEPPVNPERTGESLMMPESAGEYMVMPGETCNRLMVNEGPNDRPLVPERDTGRQTMPERAGEDPFMSGRPSQHLVIPQGVNERLTMPRVLSEDSAMSAGSGEGPVVPERPDEGFAVSQGAGECLTMSARPTDSRMVSDRGGGPLARFRKACERPIMSEGTIENRGNIRVPDRAADGSFESKPAGPVLTSQAISERIATPKAVSGSEPTLQPVSHSEPMPKTVCRDERTPKAVSRSKFTPQAALLSISTPEAADLCGSIPKSASRGERTPKAVSRSKLTPKAASRSKATPEAVGGNKTTGETVVCSNSTPEAASLSMSTPGPVSSCKTMAEGGGKDCHASEAAERTSPPSLTRSLSHERTHHGVPASEPSGRHGHSSPTAVSDRQSPPRTDPPAGGTGASVGRSPLSTETAWSRSDAPAAKKRRAEHLSDSIESADQPRSGASAATGRPPAKKPRKSTPGSRSAGRRKRPRPPRLCDDNEADLILDVQFCVASANSSPDLVLAPATGRAPVPISTEISSPALAAASGFAMSPNTTQTCDPVSATAQAPTQALDRTMTPVTVRIPAPVPALVTGPAPDPASSPARASYLAMAHAPAPVPISARAPTLTLDPAHAAVIAPAHTSVSVSIHGDVPDLTPNSTKTRTSLWVPAPVKAQPSAKVPDPASSSTLIKTSVQAPTRAETPASVSNTVAATAPALTLTDSCAATVDAKLTAIRQSTRRMAVRLADIFSPTVPVSASPDPPANTLGSRKTTPVQTFSAPCLAKTSDFFRCEEDVLQSPASHLSESKPSKQLQTWPSEPINTSIGSPGSLTKSPFLARSPSQSATTRSAGSPSPRASSSEASPRASGGREGDVDSDFELNVDLSEDDLDYEPESPLRRPSAAGAAAAVGSSLPDPAASLPADVRAQGPHVTACRDSDCSPIQSASIPITGDRAKCSDSRADDDEGAQSQPSEDPLAEENRRHAGSLFESRGRSSMLAAKGKGQSPNLLTKGERRSQGQTLDGRGQPLRSSPPDGRGSPACPAQDVECSPSSPTEARGPSPVLSTRGQAAEGDDSTVEEGEIVDDSPVKLPPHRLADADSRPVGVVSPFASRRLAWSAFGPKRSPPPLGRGRSSPPWRRPRGWGRERGAGRPDRLKNAAWDKLNNTAWHWTARAEQAQHHRESREERRRSGSPARSLPGAAGHSSSPPRLAGGAEDRPARRGGHSATSGRRRPSASRSEELPLEEEEDQLFSAVDRPAGGPPRPVGAEGRKLSRYLDAFINNRPYCEDSVSRVEPPPRAAPAGPDSPARGAAAAVAASPTAAPVPYPAPSTPVTLAAPVATASTLSVRRRRRRRGVVQLGDSEGAVVTVTAAEGVARRSESPDSLERLARQAEAGCGAPDLLTGEDSEMSLLSFCH